MSGRYRFRRRSGWRSSYGRARSSYNRGRSSLIRRAKGNARAANNQADSTDVIINLMTSTITMTKPVCYKEVKNDTEHSFILDSTVNLGTSAINIFDILCKSDFFNCYAPMYDQFRITSIKVKITPVSWSTYDQQINATNHEEIVVSANNNNDPVHDAYYVNTKSLDYGSDYQYPQALTIVTAWDRTGLSKSQFNNLTNLLQQYNSAADNNTAEAAVKTLLDEFRNNINSGINTEDQALLKSFYYTGIGDRITSYSSAQTKQLISGQAFNCTRYLYPQNQQEKSLYYSTNDLKPIFEKETNSIYYIPTSDSGLSNPISAYTQLCEFNESPSTPFKPTLLIGVLGDKDFDIKEVKQFSQDDLRYYPVYKNRIRPIKLNCEFDIGVTFRGLRKTQVV